MTFSIGPIGVIRSEIKRIEDAPLFYIEAIDGTPVIDIKPVVASVDY